jgi:tripartite-type tricarboxylate transporter receptor subunit TctC
MTENVKRVACVALAVILAGASSSVVSAQSFPAKEIRFLNAFPPGGTSDLIGRILGEQLSTQLGKQVFVENKTGASGTIAGVEAARSAPDGHTILLVSMAMMTVTPQMMKVPYDVDQDLTPIVNAGSVYNLLVVGAPSRFKTWQEIAKAGKEDPDRYTCATVGPGSSQQLSCALFMSITGARLREVPYRGGSPAILDMVGGRVDMMFGNMPEFMPQIRGGGLRPVAFGAASPSPLLPDVPVISKTGLKDFVIHNWFGVVGPGKMAPALVKRWNEELNKALATPRVQQRFKENAIEVLGGTPEQFVSQIKADRDKWGKVVRDFNIKAE